MSASASYSAKRLSDPFTVYILLNEPLQFRVSEILAALRQDYPGLSWSDTMGLDVPVDTEKFGLGVMFPAGGETREAGPISFTTSPGRCDVGWDKILQTSFNSFPDAAQAVAQHVSYLAINVPSLDGSLASRFDAARRVSCIGAIFAQLPICVGVYNPSADLVVSPKHWIEAASTAMEAKVPYFQWISFGVRPVPDGGSPVPVTVQSIGLAAFLGFEVATLKARLPAEEVLRYTYAGCAMVMEHGFEFRDGDTLGVEAGGEQLRIRFIAEGKFGMQTDLWGFLHPSSGIDDEQLFGPRAMRPDPSGHAPKNRGDAGALGKRLYRFFAGGRA